MLRVARAGEFPRNRPSCAIFATNVAGRVKEWREDRNKNERA